MTSITIVHQLRACEPCHLAFLGGWDVALYHFGFNDGHNVSIAHGCRHFIAGCYPHDPPPPEWLEQRAVPADADCHMTPPPLS